MQLSDHPSLQSNIDKRKSKNLELLKKITKFCEENNLFYSLYFGSALGAVRDKEIIKWDADIDIIINLETYENLKQQFPKNVIDNKNCKNYCYQFPRFVDTYDEKNPNSSFIDLFVAIESEPEKFLRYSKSKFNKLRAFKGYFKNFRTFYTHKFIQNLIVLCVKIFLFWVRPLTVEDAQKQVKTDKDTGIYFIVHWPNSKQKLIDDHIILKRDTQEIIKVELNGHKFNVVKNIQFYLEQIYGQNWRTPIKSNNYVFYGYYEMGKSK